MKKGLLSLLCATALCLTPMVAEDEIEQYAFVGIVAANGENIEENAFMGVRVGAQNNLWRTMLTYEDNADEMQLLFLEVDRTVMGGMADGRLRFYMGILGGLVRDNLDPVKIDGLGYGASVGLMFYLSDQIDVDVGYRYLKVDDLLAIDHYQGVTVSMHYFF